MVESMEGEPPIRLYLFNKDYQYQGIVPAPDAVTGLSVWNGTGNCAFTVPLDCPRLDRMTEPGARVVIALKRPGMNEESVLLSGPVNEIQGVGLGYLPQRVFQVDDDWDIFNEILAWPTPHKVITEQDEKWYTAVGPAETVVRMYVTANAPRQGVAVSVAASTGLGPTTTIQARMQPISDRLFPKVSDLGLGVRVYQKPDENVRRLITWIPTTRTKVLTEESGVIQPGAEFVRRSPTATRCVVGAGGEDTARVFREYIDTAAETKWGVSRSFLVDAQDIEETDPNITTLMQERADEALAENREQVSLKVELIETDYWQFGKAYELGDLIPIKLAGEETITERIREVEWDWQSDSGLEVTPRIGQYEETQEDRINRLVAKALKAVRTLEASR